MAKLNSLANGTRYALYSGPGHTLAYSSLRPIVALGYAGGALQTVSSRPEPRQPWRAGARFGLRHGHAHTHAQKAYPDAEVFGLDGDPQILSIASAKAAGAGVEIRWDDGLAYQLPYPDESFDRVVSSLVLHHLTPENKQLTLREVLRALRPGGEVHIVDFGPPHTTYARLVAHLIVRFEVLDDNLRGQLPVMLNAAGFACVEAPARFDTLFGTLAAYCGQKSGTIRSAAASPT